jgi:predicted RNase H-like HicB family nuclease
MKTNNLFTLPFTVIMIQDPNIGGYTAYFKQLQNIVAEGDTEDEAIHNLVNAVHDVFKYQSEIEDESIDTKYNVSKKSIDFTSHEYA